MGADSAALEMDQRHLDLAWEARERLRRSLVDAPRQASVSGAGSRGVRRSVDRWLEKFADPDEPVAIGRFDTEDGERRYVGKQSIHDEAENLLVVGWQSAAARPFYEATVADPRGVRLIRRFVLEKNRIVDVEQTSFTDLVQRVDELLGRSRRGPAPSAPRDLSDVLLRDLERGRTGEMLDIVQTIQATQYSLVRSPLDRLLLVEGGPGTGKTVVALHRVSWLLYNHRDRLSPDQVLVVSPNPTFTRYIRSVLPMLGDADVQHVDLRCLGPQPAGAREESADLARLKGEPRMSGLLARALRARVRVPDRSVPLRVCQAAGAVEFSVEEIESALARFVAGGSYSTARGAFRVWFTEETRRRVRAARQHRRAVAPPSASDLDAAVNRVWPSLTPQAFLRDLLGSRHRLLACAGDEFSAGDIGRLLRAPADRLSQERWTLADVALLDEADALIGGNRRTYRHVVVDEAQDLSPMQLRSLRRRCATGSYTVVGDLAQSTGPWTRSSWDDLVRTLSVEHPVSHRGLAHGYRVPRQVFEFAARLLPQASPGTVPPVPVRDGPGEPVLLRTEPDRVAESAVAQARDYAGRGLFVGIICPGCRRRAVTDRLADDDVRWSDVGRGDLGLSINLVRPEEAKGLEFDAVVVVEPHEIATGGPRGLRLLYVALTRTTQFLSVVYSRSPLPIPGAVPTPSDHDRAPENPETQDLMPSELMPSELPNPDRPSRQEVPPEQSGDGRRMPTTQELPPLPPPLLPPTDGSLPERRPRTAKGRHPESGERQQSRSGEDDGQGRFASPSPAEHPGAGGLLGSFGRPDQGQRPAGPPETPEPVSGRRRAAVRRPDSVPAPDGRLDGDPSGGHGRPVPRGGQAPARDITAVRSSSPRPGAQDPAGPRPVPARPDRPSQEEAWQAGSAPAVQRQRPTDPARRPAVDRSGPPAEGRGAGPEPARTGVPVPVGSPQDAPPERFGPDAFGDREQAPRGNDPLDTRVPWYAPDEGFDPADWHHESSTPVQEAQRPGSAPADGPERFEPHPEQRFEPHPEQEFEPHPEQEEARGFFDPFADAYPDKETAHESSEWFGDGFSRTQQAPQEPLPSMAVPTGQRPGHAPLRGVPGTAGPEQGEYPSDRPGQLRGPVPEERGTDLPREPEISRNLNRGVSRSDGDLPLGGPLGGGRDPRADGPGIDVRQAPDRAPTGPGGTAGPGGTRGTDGTGLAGPGFAGRDGGPVRPDRPGAPVEPVTICLDDLHEAVAAGIARQIARALRSAAAPTLWPVVLTLLDEELRGDPDPDDAP